jgi:uncharacterized membrane protein
MSEINLIRGEKMAYQILIWLLRIIHIVGGVFWVGGVLMMTFFVVPTIGAVGETGQKFMGYLMNNRKLSSRLAAAGGSTVLAGLILFGLDARAGAAWGRSHFAIGLSIGAAFALIGFVVGILVGRTNKSMAQLGAQMQGKPSSDQLTQMQAMQKRQATLSSVNAITLVLAVVFMAIARYL